MNTVINLGIPHVGEQIFQYLETKEQLRCLEVSTTWKILTENVIFDNWKHKTFEACERQQTQIIKILLEHPNSGSVDWNVKDEDSGQGAFFAACSSGNKEMIKLFLDHSDRGGINLNARDNWGQNASMAACNGFFGYHPNYEVVKLLLEADKNIDWK